MAGPACAGPLGQIEPTIATVDDTAVPDRLSISCHLLAVQIGCSLSAQQVPLCLTLQRVSRPFLRVTFFKASWAGTADSRRRRRQYLFSDKKSSCLNLCFDESQLISVTSFLNAVDKDAPETLIWGKYNVIS